MKIYKITPDGGNSCCEKDLDAIMEWLRESDTGSIYTIEVMEMSEEKYDNLIEMVMRLLVI